MTQQPPWAQPPAQNYGQGPVAPAANYGPNAGGQPGPAVMTPFNSPGSAAGGSGSVRLHQLNGRLLLLKVLTYDAEAAGFGEGAKPGPQAVCECAVLDGPPITSVTDGRTQQVAAQLVTPASPPFYIPTLYCRGAVLAARNLAPFVGQFVVGRLAQGTQGTKGNPPWVLNDPTPEEMAFAQQVGASWEQFKVATEVQVAEPVQPPQQAFTQNPPPWGGPQQGQNPPWQQPAAAQPQPAPPWGYQGQ
jgi:hypothetical protein